ncbi:helix-turn-helix transcriptional regulator [Schlesneria sp. DSM 10557]|uniref:helix-turn-helix transcriptional regulator n=1 Tax=Schlesneria sp. DSM 10557 TaxID=3044399 RepID=UPI0035A19BD0
MDSSTPVQRQWRILIALMYRRQGQTVKELSQEFEVNTRTILRDLNTLRQAGFPLSERVSDFGRKHWRLTEGGPRAPIHFTWPEAVSLYLGRQFLDPLAGTYFWKSAQTAFTKIQSMLGEAALSQLEKVSRHFFQTIPGRPDYSGKAEVIDRLMQAVEEHRIAFVAYQSERATEPVSLEMYPYGIAYHKGALYLVAWSRDHDSIRHFKIDRVSGVDIQQLQFTPDPDFSLEKHFANSFGVFRSEAPEQPPLQRIRIRFAPSVARYVQEKIWHASQQLKRENDGSVTLELQLENTQELKSWIQSFGPKATVLEPKSLKTEIIDDLRELLKNYTRQESANK